MQLLPADVVAVHGSGVIELGIEVVTDSPISHVAIVADDTRCIESQGGREVGYAPLSEYAGHSLILRAVLTDAQRTQIIQFAKSKFGAKYDYEAIIKEFGRYEFHEHIDPNEHGKFICSSLIVAAYQSAGVQLTDVPLASPDDLYRSDRFTIVGRF